MEVGVEAGLGLVSSQLVVSSIDWEDAGVYNCRARDGTEGRIEKNKATLSVQGELSRRLIMGEYSARRSKEHSALTAVCLNHIFFIQPWHQTD